MLRRRAARYGGRVVEHRSRWGSAPRSYLVDAVIWAAITLPVVAAPSRDRFDVGPTDIVATAIALPLLLARRRWPIPAAAIGLTSAVAVTAFAGRPTAILPVCVVLLFSVAISHDRRTTIATGLAGLAAFVTCIAILVSNDFIGPELLAGIAWPAAAVAAGDAIRSRREAIAAAEDRAERAERSRDAEARRRVAEERLHIARELHDVVAHRIAVVNVQAGVAAHLVRSDPDGAETALATVRSSAREVLDELAGILGVLRTDDGSAPVEPTPSLDRLPELIESFEAAGLDVRHSSSGPLVGISDAASLAVFRTVQEALTNAHKHGTGPVRLDIHTEHDGITVTVENQIAAGRASDVGGYGLIGMRERIAAVGGALDVGPDGAGRFLVRARVRANESDGATR
jgi:signal transduction histidine kinase